jgi:RNA polymerase sigma-70 factor (ECF subfamily)
MSDATGSSDQAVPRDGGHTLPALFATHRSRLRRIVAARLHPGLRQRVDPSDVLQEVYLDAMRVYAPADPPQRGPFVWLCGLVRYRLGKVHRRHLSAGQRAVARERPDATAAVADGQRSPGSQAACAEARSAVRRAVEALPPAARQIVELRDFDGLTNSETAARLGLSPTAAAMRYGRALRDLKAALDRGAGDA